MSSTNRPDVPRIYDFHAVNDMLQDSIPLIETEVSRRYGRWVGWLDQIAGGYDMIFTNYGIRVSRGLGWYNATRLADARGHAEARAAIEKSPALVVANILDPPIWSLRLLARLMRLVARLVRRWPTTDASAAVRDAVARVAAGTSTTTSG